MEAGVEGNLVSDKVLEVDVPQAFVADTDSVPEIKDEGISMEMEVPLFTVRLQPAGTVQLYEVAPETAAME